ncbi:MAG: SusC/RagA family TonB-linked outer membrane protein [Gemmatimonadaceae bacterium]
MRRSPRSRSQCRAQSSALPLVDGTFSIARVPAGVHTITARQIGYGPLSRSITVGEGLTASVNFALHASATDLQQVVVTGTAGNQTRAAQSAVVNTISASDVVSKSPITNATEILQSRVPGVTVSTGTGTLGASSRIQIMGASSISLSNEPLIFIDGVRMNNTQRGSSNALGGQTVSPLNDINPNDIESIEVVQGPAAATLYGADASAGVIQIITKRGRVGAKHLTQTVTGEYDNIDPNFTPNDAYGKCSAAQVAPGGPAICQGLQAGAVVHDNPLVAADVFKHGSLASLNYNVQGGGDNLSYFASALVDNEVGTQVNNTVIRRSGRVNTTYVVGPKLSFNAGIAVERNDYKLPQGDQSSYAPLILQAEAAPTGSFPAPIAGIQNIATELLTLRQTPTFTANYSPAPWFTNRLTLGGDLSNTQYSQFYPKNNQNWYTGTNANGSISTYQDTPNTYTVDYLGNIRTKLGSRVTSDLSFGTQYINSVDNFISGSGTGGLVSNLSNLVGSAATNLGAQSYVQQKSLGILGQEQLGFGDRLYLQAGLRADRNSSFGSSAGTFLEPKVGASYVISQESFWKHLEPVVSSMRLRASYGTTGRSPPSGAALTTYVAQSYISDAGAFVPGFTTASPGNANLKPETGKEFETGFDAGFFNDRAALTVTYYNKRSDNLLVLVPPAPSQGFGSSPYKNIGSVINRGFEYTARATPVDRTDFRWDLNFNAYTNFNKILSMGNVPPFTNNFRLFAPGLSVGEWYVQKVVSVDTVKGVAYATHTPQTAGRQFPSLTESFNTTFTIFGNLRISSLVDGKFGYRIYNLGQNYSDDAFRTSAAVNLPPGQGGYSTEEKLRRTGPYVDVETGTPLSYTTVKAPYIQSGNFVRWRELSATLLLPERFARHFGAQGASLSVGARNLKLWTKFEGYDPEVIGTGPGFANTSTYAQVFTPEVFTVPQSSRVYTRINLTF